MSQNTIDRLVKEQEGDAISLGVASSKDSVASKKSGNVTKPKSKVIAKGGSTVKANAASNHSKKAQSHSLPSGNTAKSKSKVSPKGDSAAVTAEDNEIATGSGVGEEKGSQNSQQNSQEVSQNSGPVPEEIQTVSEGVAPANTHRKVTCVRYIRPIGGRQQDLQPSPQAPPQPQQICIISPPSYPSPCSPSPVTYSYCMTPYGCYPCAVSNPYPPPPPVCPPPIICSIPPPPPAPVFDESQREYLPNSTNNNLSNRGNGSVPQNCRPIIIKTDKPFYRRKGDDDYYDSCRDRSYSDYYYGKGSNKCRTGDKSKSRYCRSRMSNDDGGNPSKTRSLMMKRYIKQSTTGSEAAAPTVASSKSGSEDSNTLVVTKIVHHYHKGSNSKSVSGSTESSLGRNSKSVKSVPGVVMKPNPSVSALVDAKKPSKMAVNKPTTSALSLPKSKSVVNIPSKLVQESGKTKALKKRQEFDAKQTKSVHLIGETKNKTETVKTIPKPTGPPNAPKNK